jgi:hypothetical protein
MKLKKIKMNQQCLVNTYLSTKVRLFNYLPAFIRILITSLSKDTLIGTQYKQATITPQEDLCYWKRRL